MNRAQDLVFELLRISTGVQESLSCTYSEREWTEAFDIAEKQTITGVLFDGIESLTTNSAEYSNLLPSKVLLLQWIGTVRILEQNTLKLTEVGGEW